MRQADRILRTIYRERFFRINNDSLVQPNLFMLEASTVQQTCKTCYQKLYPFNYSGDELDEVLSYQCMLLKKRFDCTDSIFMFPYYAERLFKVKQSKILVRYEDILEWNGFQNKVDANAFIAAFAALHQKEELVRNTNIVVEHDNERLYKILSSGICEGHMHLKGSGLTTEIMWSKFLEMSFLNLLQLEEFIKNPNNFLDFKMIGYTDDEIYTSLFKVKIARILLMNRIDGNLTQEQKNLICFLDAKNKDELDALTVQYSTLLQNEISKFTLELERERELPASHSERIFLYKMFKRILNNKKDCWERNLLNYYLWGAAVYKFELYQDNVGMGFQKFKQFENVKSNFIENDVEIYRSVFERYYEERNVKKIEFRIAPKKRGELQQLQKELEKENQKVFEKYRQKYPNITKIKFGIIIHYIKNEKLAQDARYYVTGRFSSYRNEIRNKANVVAKILESDARIFELEELAKFNKKILAIDAANVEVGCPPEVFAVHFRKHRKQIESAGGIAFTFHVGEEFKTLESGIRNIDEAIDYLEYQRGDRLGHALALGFDVDKYFKKKRYKIITSIQDYLDNIVWMYGLFTRKGIYQTEYVNYLRDLYERNMHKLLNHPVSINDYLHSMALRSDNIDIYSKLDVVKSIEEINEQMSNFYCFDRNSNVDWYNEAFLNPRARELNYFYLYNIDLLKRSKEPKEFAIDSIWIEMVKLAQSIVKEKLIQRGIVVEANPSSNRKISSVNKYIDLPFFRMNTFKLDDNLNEKHVAITINTDDSAIFQTNLSNEYSLIARALELEGYETEKVYDYIEYLRESSCIHNFVPDEVFEERIEEQVKEA